MKSGLTLKSIVLWFAIVLALYLGTFYGIEHLNRKNGAWEVEFTSDETGNPSIVIYQPKLEISTVEIIFAGEKAPRTNFSEKVLFDHPLKTLPAPSPIGEIIYEDLRALPGVVTFNFFGHEVELLPRTLIVDKKEIPWKSETVIELSETNKLPHAPKAPKGWN
jgi:hypothetical protein